MPPPPPDAYDLTGAVASVEAAFASDGLLVHMVDMRDYGSRHERFQNREAKWYHDVIGEAKEHATSVMEPGFVNADCGPYCYAMSLLTPQLPIAAFSIRDIYELGGGFLHDAGRLWRYTSCAAVIDSNSANRACCACQDQRDPVRCPFSLNEGGSLYPHNDAGYCAAACGASGTDDLCRQLHAGCGVNVIEARNFCSREKVLSGQCSQCSTPDWCDSPGNWFSDFFKRVNTSQKWMDAFMYHNAGWRQCKWKPSQKKTFVAAAHQFNVANKRAPDTSSWATENEVNMYVGPGDLGATSALFDSLLGFVYMRTTAAADDLPRLRKLRDKFQRLGMALPIYAITNEPAGAYVHWDPKAPIAKLTDGPYSLRLLDNGSGVTVAVEVHHEGQECYGRCGDRAGACPGFCGIDGACCRMDWGDAGDACGSGSVRLGCNGRHCCAARIRSG